MGSRGIKMCADRPRKAGVCSYCGQDHAELRRNGVDVAAVCPAVRGDRQEGR